MEKVIKSWGYEHWFVNTARYCGKLLFVEIGKWSSHGAYHYHKMKDETFFVIEGSLRIDYIDQDGTFKSVILNQYESMRIYQLIKHRFTAVSPDGCKFIEASTSHRDDDSYRVTWDGQQWEKV